MNEGYSFSVNHAVIILCMSLVLCWIMILVFQARRMWQQSVRWADNKTELELQDTLHGDRAEDAVESVLNELGIKRESETI